MGLNKPFQSSCRIYGPVLVTIFGYLNSGHSTNAVASEHDGAMNIYLCEGSQSSGSS